MAPRRQLVLLLSAIALVASSFALAPLRAQTGEVTFFVDTTADNDAPGGCTNSAANGDCSLRQAIVAANAYTPATARKIISFQYYTDGDLSTTGAVFTLDAAKALLPPITANNVEVIANTGFGIPEIQINGNGKAVGLRLEGDDGRVSGLSMYGFTNFGLEPFLGSAIYITGDRNEVVTSWIGIAPNGSTPSGGQNFSGVRIDGGGTGNVIGGPGGESVANYISGNAQNGVIIRNSSGNLVQNNFIGLARPNGETRVELRGNGQYGVQIVSLNGTSANNIIGGPSIGLANIIGGNGQAGILLRDTGTTSTTIQANYIGIDKLTNTDYGNTGDGILLENGTSANVIGGLPAAPLVVSGNSDYGIHLRTEEGAPPPRDNRIAGTVYIGTGIGGTPPEGSVNLGNDDGGILVADRVIGTRIEGTGTSLRVAGNGGPGILVQGSANDSTLISGTLVGIVPIAGTGAGTTSQDLPNAGGGILIDRASRASVLFSTISGNPQFGLRLSGALTTTVQGNFVGPDLARTGTFPNGAGVELLDTGNTSLIANTVTGHAQPGVLLRGAAGSTVLSNTISANTGGGLLLETVGVSQTVRTGVISNTISGNGQYGLRLSGALTTTLNRNFVGLSVSRTAAVPNTGNGIEIFNAVNTLAIDSYVAANTGAGIVVSGTDTFSTSIRNSNIGMIFTAATGGFTAPAANGLQALRISGGPDGPRRTEVLGGVFGGAGTTETSPAGILIEGTSGVTVTGVTIGGVKAVNTPTSPPTLPRPFGPGIAVTGTLSDVQLIGNSLRFNRGPGIVVEGDADRVRLRDNRLAQNAAGIRLVGTTLFTPPRTSDPGSQANPNHDIDPPPVDVVTFSDPLRLRVGDQGVIAGFVITSTSRIESELSPVSACVTCTVQLFRPDEGLADGQGWIPLATRAVGDTSGQPASSFPVNPDGSFTRQVVGGVANIGQLLLVATDGFGNSSEYAVFPIRPGFTLESLTPPQSAGPGETVTYTLRLSNTGTLDVTGLRLQTSGTLASWRVATDPITNTLFTIPTPLEAGTSRLITVSLTLPPGPNPQVNAGVRDVTTVRVVKDNSVLSQSLQLQTTVLPRPVLVVTPTNSLGSARPGETVPHTHVIRNNGNVTVTAGLSFTTRDPVGQTGLWATSITPSAITLAPGEETRVRVDVLVPPGAQVEDGDGNRVQAVTTVTATVPLSPTGGFGPVSRVFTDTTRVDLDPDAALLDGDQEQPGAAGEQVIFTHVVENLSNARTRFCFVWSTNLGSTMTFRSATDGFVIDANGCFTMDTANAPSEGRFQRAQFDAVVTVNPRALPGDTDIVNISLRNQDTGELIGSARVVNRINVLIGLKRPRIYLPLVAR